MRKSQKEETFLREAIKEVIKLVLLEKKPGGPITLSGARRITEPTKWVGDMTRAISASGGDVEAAAERAGVSTRTFYGYMDDNRTIAAAADQAQAEEENKKSKEEKEEKKKEV